MRVYVICHTMLVMDLHLEQHSIQNRWKRMDGKIGGNPHNLVFTKEAGQHVSRGAAYKNFKQIVTEMRLPKVRLHDLRHTRVTLFFLKKPHK